MYKIAIPVNNKKLTDSQKERLVRELKKADPQIVMLIHDRILRDSKAKALEHEHFVENKAFLEANGFNCRSMGGSNHWLRKSLLL